MAQTIATVTTDWERSVTCDANLQTELCSREVSLNAPTTSRMESLLSGEEVLHNHRRQRIRGSIPSHIRKTVRKQHPTAVQGRDLTLRQHLLAGDRRILRLFERRRQTSTKRPRYRPDCLRLCDFILTDHTDATTTDICGPRQDSLSTTSESVTNGKDKKKDKNKQVISDQYNNDDDYPTISENYCSTDNSIAITCVGEYKNNTTTSKSIVNTCVGDYTKTTIPTSQSDTSGYYAAAITTTATIGPTNLDSRTIDALGTFAILGRVLCPPIPRRFRLLFHTGCNINDSPTLHTSVWRTTHYSYDHVSRIVVLGSIPDGHEYKHYDILHDLTFNKDDSTHRYEIYMERLFDNEWMLDSSLHALICIATSTVYTAGSAFDYDRTPDLVYDFVSPPRLLPCTPVCYEFKFATPFGAYQIWTSADDIKPRRILVFDCVGIVFHDLVLVLQSSSYRKQSMFRDIIDHTQSWILGDDTLTCVQSTISYNADWRYQCSLHRLLHTPGHCTIDITLHTVSMRTG